jgi:hypothetical protein
MTKVDIRLGRATAFSDGMEIQPSRVAQSVALCEFLYHPHIKQSNANLLPVASFPSIKRAEPCLE